MSVTRYTKMAYDCADDMVFGTAKSPVAYGFGLKIGAGHVIPEINYAPRPGTEKDPEKLITKDILDRAITAGFPDVQLETEWVSQMNQEKLSAPVVAGQQEMCEKYHEEFGLNCGTRQTIPDQREADHGLRPGMDSLHGYPEKLFECYDIACENGCNNLSIESVGGKEFADYAVTNGDIVAFLFGVGYLGSIDMTWLWQQMADIAKKNKCVAGGDTNCSGANVSMFMAGGMMDQDVQRTFSAVTRAISAARTLCAWEAGAIGPDKDCGYEGVIVKAIAGKPTTQEGKNCQCAHCDLQGNLIAQCCDLWSNESVEYHPEFGGTSVQCWLGSIGYEASLMNTAIQLKQEKIQRPRGLHPRIRQRLADRKGHRRIRRRPVHESQGRRNEGRRNPPEGIRVQGDRADRQAARDPPGHQQKDLRPARRRGQVLRLGRQGVQGHRPQLQHEELRPLKRS